MRKKEILPFVTTWMDLEGIMLSEVSQTAKDEHCMALCVGSKKKSSTQRNKYKWQNGDCQGLRSGSIGEKLVKEYKLL